MSELEENADPLIAAGQARNSARHDNLIVQSTNPLPPSSNHVVEPKQGEPSVAAVLGKGKVVLIMCALCVSPEDFGDRIEPNPNAPIQIAVFLAAIDTVSRDFKNVASAGSVLNQGSDHHHDRGAYNSCSF